MICRYQSCKNIILTSLVNNVSDLKVAELNEMNSRSWKKEMIEATFPEEVAEKILRTPLAKEPYKDFRA